ncbi:MAG: hypothetical protein ACOYNC_02040 [Bacteroidales bacterium]
MMTFLKLISCIALCCIVSWRLSAQPVMPQIAGPGDSIGMYRIAIDLDTLHFTGLLLFIERSDSTWRVVMNADMGPKLLDMDISSSGFKTRYAFPGLNHRKTLKTLFEDFRALTGILTWKKECMAENNPGSMVLTCHPDRKTKVFYSSSSSMQPISSGTIEVDSRVVSEFQYSFVPGTHKVSTMKMRHLNFRMNITLNRL